MGQAGGTNTLKIVGSAIISERSAQEPEFAASAGRLRAAGGREKA